MTSSSLVQEFIKKGIMGIINMFSGWALCFPKANFLDTGHNLFSTQLGVLRYVLPGYNELKFIRSKFADEGWVNIYIYI